MKNNMFKIIKTILKKISLKEENEERYEYSLELIKNKLDSTLFYEEAKYMIASMLTKEVYPEIREKLLTHKEMNTLLTEIRRNIAIRFLEK